MKCGQARRLFGAYWDDEITQAEREWLEAHGYTSVAQMKGAMSQRKVADPSSLVRANYIKVLETYRDRPG